jgi:UDP-N-acetylglucosamine--N-acetylmuramyl-(pentapeptide) pyrophosphoryl-undecaprenol N-acetylglucosamine transferase
MPHLVVMAAGTGGHIMPGLAVAREMQARGWTVSWLGTTHGMENRLVPPEQQSGIALDALAFSGLRGKGLVHALTGGIRLLKAMWDSLAILRRRGADAVLGMGGYVCFPGGLMASLLNKPLVLMNGDAALLLSNKSLLPLADRVAFGFESPDLAKARSAVVTGNPVRAQIEAIAPAAERYAARSGPLRLLVVGGSLGAQVLNETVPRALALLPPAERPLVAHQCGTAHLEAVRAAYATAGVPADIVPFIDDMPERLAQADLMVCRAGSMTVAEICAAGVAAILVPFIASTTAHQRDNAAWMAARNAAVHLPQDELTAERLAALLRSMDRRQLAAMAQAARTLAKPKAAARLADEIEALFAQKKAGQR